MVSDLDPNAAVQLAALQSAIREKQRKENPVDSEGALRRIFRWYSKTFYTPLHEVDGLPLLDVLTAFWEESYEEKTLEELLVERTSLLEPLDDLKKRQFIEDENDADVWEIAQEVIETTKEAAKSIDDILKKPKDSAITRFGPRDREAQLVQALPDTSKLPDIKMTFTDEEFDLETDSFGFGMLQDPKPRK